ncbi:phage tail terminator protein [Lactiplantibacillus mudanjiangensis]|uniref:Minor capsid protein [Lactobacillus plantarum subsp. plantarum] n=1 Tax=Lactiplantibacillus mudanjiangensis TaxID=1296538 RepID=A0A660E6G1_9LACO|nr:minor capsid protein [Lactiplantibacillus mudanjiangensis]VDG26348.1 minor capsid protein [Lactobacillus plantarum subsp. plantarum] [Lactiplantibacillus mudanjiangensis]VDG27872.1 minor capsid protein [Lactobacillus plantarum subsp. plantarum] [Lactiplantibacillus mudanjiangensis]
MDLMECLQDVINAIPNLPMQCNLGYLTAEDSLMLYPLPGSRSLDEDYAGNQQWQMNYEVGFKTKTQSLANGTLWAVSQRLDTLTADDVVSQNGSFEFESLAISGQPNITMQDTQGYNIYQLSFSVIVNTFADAN